MSVDSQGWLSWAIKMPGRYASGKGFNAGTNAVKGLVFHSAEGWAATLLSNTSQWGYYNAEYPWHLSNLLDGRLVQHFPFTARCWHGSAFNNDYVGMEHEGVTPTDANGHALGPGPVLNAGQIANAQRVIADLGAWKGWTPRRPNAVGDLTATLYEHRETVWFGGTSTGCPNGRIPWDLILATEGDMPEEHYPGEFNDRRARDMLIWSLMLPSQDPAKLKVALLPGGGGFALLGAQGVRTEVACPVPEWGRAT